MMQGTHRDTLVETLLNSLQAERYMRAPLLMTIIDELADDIELQVAADAARAMLNDIASLSDDALVKWVDVLRHLVRTLAPPSRACA